MSEKVVIYLQQIVFIANNCFIFFLMLKTIIFILNRYVYAKKKIVFLISV